VELKEGDLVITLPEIEKIRSVIDKIDKGRVGIVVSTSPKFDKKNVYGILIDGKVYYLFNDEIKKIEEIC
jgi:hypothetical protein